MALDDVVGASMILTVVGCGYVGTVTAACLSTLGHSVRAYDTDAARVGQLQAGHAVLREPDLVERCRRGIREGSLCFTDEPDAALSGRVDAVFLCVGTPRGPDGQPDVGQLESAASSIAPRLRGSTVVVTRSTVPVGSGDWLRVRLEAASEAPGRWKGEIVANPEFLREGSAVSDFLHPDRIVIGGTDEGCDVVERAFAPILSQSFVGGCLPVPRLFRMDRISAEMVKYAANAALATKISFANEIAGLCELTGADARSVLPAVGADPRIGERNLEPGLGWGGSCFPKDTAALTAMAAEYGVRAHLLEAACAVNDGQVHSILTKLRSTLRTLKGRTIALWGLTFKPETDDVRSSPSLTLARELQRLGAWVVASDPAVKSLPEPDDAITVVLDPLEAVEGADALVVATAWPSFASVPAEQVAARMRGHLVIDARNLLRPTDVQGAGLSHIGVGWVPEP